MRRPYNQEAGLSNRVQYPIPMKRAPAAKLIAFHEMPSSAFIPLPAVPTSLEVAAVKPVMSNTNQACQ